MTHQSVFSLPHLVAKSKDDCKHALKVWLVGLADYLKPNKIFWFTMTEIFETDASDVIDVVHRFVDGRARCGSLPLKLFIQHDDCTLKSKNRYAFAYF